MAHEPDSLHPHPSDPDPKQPRSTWIVLAAAALFLVIFAVTGLPGVAVWLVLAGIVVLLTAAYALIRRRQTWARASDAKKRRQLLAVGGGLLVVGFVAAAVAGPPDQGQRPADDQSSGPSPASSPASPTPTEEPLANQECAAEADTRSQGTVQYVCTPNGNGKLVWMDKESSEKLTEARKQAEETQRQVEEAAAAEEAQRQAEAARKQAEEAQRQADEAAAAAEAQQRAEEAAAAEEAQRQADEAAAAEAQRLADEQARERQRQEEQPPADNFTYANCTAVQEAGAAPIHRGDYGWQEGLDRDKDGVACAGN
ncbi:small-conductance mechanosensitive channel [Arthrobacter sp. UYP6]|uniref:excalibur calcium-binding domain-containing protein n=1 Tax=Arthrobacter sp. UYP6 TaxID=1756378 RepID=UPI003397A323